MIRKPWSSIVLLVLTFLLAFFEISWDGYCQLLMGGTSVVVCALCMCVGFASLDRNTSITIVLK